MSEEKQIINEMALAICKSRGVAEVDDCSKCGRHTECLYQEIALGLYKADYRRQSEGEWIEQIKTTTNAKGMTAYYTINFCSNCGYEIGTIRYRHKYCPNCGAKMKGGAE